MKWIVDYPLSKNGIRNATDKAQQTELIFYLLKIT